MVAWFVALQTLELNGDDGRTVDTEVCFPRAITQEQGTPNQATIPAGAAWTDVTLARAVRFSRYASTLHGCLPGDHIYTILLFSLLRYFILFITLFYFLFGLLHF